MYIVLRSDKHNPHQSELVDRGDNLELLEAWAREHTTRSPRFTYTVTLDTMAVR